MDTLTAEVTGQVVVRFSAVEASARPFHGVRLTTIRQGNLRDVKADFFVYLDDARDEIPFLREALIAGRIDGRSYEGDCACLVGTIAKARGCWIGDINPAPNPDRLTEQFFTAIDPGDTPDNSPVALLVLYWLDEYAERRTHA